MYKREYKTTQNTEKDKLMYKRINHIKKYNQLIIHSQSWIIIILFHTKTQTMTQLSKYMH